MTTKPEDALVELVQELRNARMMVNYGHGDVRDEPDPLHERAADAITTLLEREKRAIEGFEKAFIFICENMPLGPTNDRTKAGELIDSLRVSLAEAHAALTGDGVQPDQTS